MGLGWVHKVESVVPLSKIHDVHMMYETRVLVPTKEVGMIEGSV